LVVPRRGLLTHTAYKAEKRKAEIFKQKNYKRQEKYIRKKSKRGQLKRQNQKAEISKQQN